MAKGINYGQLFHKALCSFIAEVLAQVARDGLPGKHHFFISFDTTHPGVDMAASLKQRYPEEMTIVMQDWFADLAVMKDRFSVTLSFGSVPETIVIPFDAIKTFVDPSVEFGLRLKPNEVTALTDDESEDDEPPPPTPIKPASPGEGAVVRLDKFRKH